MRAPKALERAPGPQMPDPTCPAGSERKPATPEMVYATIDDYAAAWGPVWPLLLPLFPIPPWSAIDAIELCEAPPAGPFNLTAEQIVEALAQGRWDTIMTLRETVENRLRWHLWNTHCQCTAVAQDAGECYWDVLEAQAPDAYWKLDESSGTTLNDASGNGRHFNLVHGQLRQTGPMAGMYAIGDSNTPIGATTGRTAATRASFSNQVTNVTISMWVWQRGNRHLNDHHIFKNQPSGATNGYQFLWNMSGNKSFAFYHGGVAVNNPGSPDYWDGTAGHEGWKHLAIRMLNGSCELYINGSLFMSHTHSNPLAPTSANMVLGGDWYGAIAAPAYWNRLLSVAEIQAQYAAQAGCTPSPTPIEAPTTPTLPSGITAPPTLVCDEAQLCTDLTALRLQLAATAEQVNVIQRQAAPFAYQQGTPATGLSGTGSVAVRSALGVRVDLTTLPSAYGWIAANPNVLMDVGWVALGTAEGYLPAQRISHDPLLIIPPLGGIVTSVSYYLRPGVVATITPLERLR